MSDQAARHTPVVVEMPLEIDVTNSKLVYDQLAAALRLGVDTVIADLTSTSFCDSSGVHALLRAHESAVSRDVRLRLAVSQHGTVRRVLQLTGIGDLMPVYPSLAEAVQAA
jgi:anti-sigma B factor antagonist